MNHPPARATSPAPGYTDSRHPAWGRRPPLDPVSAYLDRDATDALLSAAGHGALEAFATFYDGTAPVLFGLLRSVLDDPTQAENATVEIYRHIWRTAPLFDPAGRSAYALLLHTARREMVCRCHYLRRLDDPAGPPPDPDATPPPPRDQIQPRSGGAATSRR